MTHHDSIRHDSAIPETTADAVGPAILVIFGASGDLTQRKLIPALYNLARDHLLSDRFAVLGVAGSELSDEAYRARLEAALREHVREPDAATWAWLQARIAYCPANVHDAAAYPHIGERLAALEAEWGIGGDGDEGERLFYLAIPPSLFAPVVAALSRHGLIRCDGKGRVVVEKPFGHDLESARGLNRALLNDLNEHQIYRIDHYLGKETVQNLLVLRFANAIFEPIWNHRYIDHVQITVAEALGVAHRGRYYEEAGAMRDMVPNHLMQLLAFIAMEPPTSFDAEAVRNKKAEVLKSIQPLTPEDVIQRTVRGQYGPGEVAGEGLVVGYRSEPHVDPTSRTETYVAMKLQLDNWRWSEVPFYLRTGKRLPRHLTEIVIQFKRVPFMLFRHTPVDHLEPNQLIIRIQPREAITLRFGAKRPGPSLRIGNVDMAFCYAELFGPSPTTGYETLLYDAIKGDATLYQRADSIAAGWEVVQPILDVWQALPPRDFANYAAGSWGPRRAAQLLSADGRQWRDGQ